MNNNKASQKTDLILDILLFATKNNLNITDSGDVKKILDALHITYTEDDFNEWMNDIQDFEERMESLHQIHQDVGV